MTREEAKNIVKGITDKIEATTDIDDWAEFWGFTREDYEEFLEMSIKTLEQEPILDKIRAEILAMMPPLGKWMYEEGHIEEQTTCEVIADVVQIIDKYKAESEDKE